jgi:glucosamine--fructose-6-phosphate aminotransferase (isomerizing)
MTDRVAMLRGDIEAGPSALAALLDAYGAAEGPLAALGERPSVIGCVGLGSSRYAALAAAAGAWHGGLPAWAEYASAASLPSLPSDGAMLAISASGRTREVIELARERRGRERVIAVTNDPASPLAAEADAVLPLVAGAEGAGIATRTFRATIAVLALVVGHWTDGAGGTSVREMRGAVEALGVVMDGREAWLDEAAELLDGATSIDVLGDATDSALTQQAALMLREAPRIPALTHDTADWLHTAVYQAWPGHRALLFGGSASDADVVDTIRRRGGETVVVGSEIEGAALVIPTPRLERPFQKAIVLSVVAELLALELWDRTSAEELPQR